MRLLLNLRDHHYIDIAISALHDYYIGSAVDRNTTTNVVSLVNGIKLEVTSHHKRKRCAIMKAIHLRFACHELIEKL